MIHTYKNGHILLYHGVFSQIPSALEGNIHNVKPTDFYDQVNWLVDNFQIVTVDDFLKAENRQGLAVITFDDAYAGIFSEAIPWLIEEKIPSTVYLNSNLVMGEAFWRDKIRFIINNRLENEFVSSCQNKKWHEQVRSERLYRDSKRPSLNSQWVDGALDDFFVEIQITHPEKKAQIDSLSTVISRPEGLINHPLVRYGNHTSSHYVMSSMNSEEQRAEVHNCGNWLENTGLPTTQTFAAPFGGTADINSATFSVLNDTGCSALLMSRKRVNKDLSLDGRTKLPILERYMAPETLSQLIELSIQLENV